MNKGVDALQMVFAMFILIVVTLVMIKLFTGIVKPDTLPKIDDFQHAYNYNLERNRCGGLCNSYTTGGCTDTKSAVAYCREKVRVDINGDGRTGERKAYGIVAGIPFCEDGLYCSHIYKCECGYVELDAKECLDIMKDFYTTESGSEATAKDAVCKAIQPGECPKDPRIWKKQLPGYEPVIIKSGKYTGQIWGADYWWKISGYEDLCGGSASSLSLICYNPAGTKDIQCSWSGCSGNTEVILGITPGTVNRCNPSGDKRPAGGCSVSNMASGVYYIVLDCDGVQTSKSVTVA